jgi:ferrous iron transport protein B
VLGFLKLSALTMLAMYLLGIVVALFMAWLFKKTLLRGEPPMLIMELPPYKAPVLKVVLRHMWDRSRLFLRRAGTVILGINILLWFLATYPKSSEVALRFERDRQMAITNAFPQATPPWKPSEMDAYLKVALARPGAETNSTAEFGLFTRLAELEKESAGENLRHSFAGRAGQWIEPLIAPLGFDWKMGIGIVTSFAAREVFVSTMSTVYSLGQADDSAEGTSALAQRLQEQRRPDGTRLYTPLTGVTLMVFYVFALQCVSTVAVVRRETNGWKWPLFQWAYMGMLAWGLAFVTYRGGLWLGWGP